MLSEKSVLFNINFYIAVGEDEQIQQYFVLEQPSLLDRAIRKAISEFNSDTKKGTVYNGLGFVRIEIEPVYKFIEDGENTVKIDPLA